MAINDLIATGKRLGNPSITVDEFVLDGTVLGGTNTLTTSKSASILIEQELEDFTTKLALLGAEMTSLGENPLSPNKVRELTNMSNADISVRKKRDYYIGEDRLSYLVSPDHYERSGKFHIKSRLTSSGRRTLVVPDVLSVLIPSGKKLFFWHGKFLGLAMLTLGAGMDYCIYACDRQDGSTLPKIIVSPHKIAPNGYTIVNSRKIGGFHTVGTDIGDSVSTTHPLYGFTAGDILPDSIWDLNLRPAGCDPYGMVYCSSLDLWVDIYLNDFSGSSVYKADALTSIPQVTAIQLLKNQGKRLLTSSEFPMVMDGSPEQEANNNYHRELDIGLDFISSGGMILSKCLTMDSEPFIFDTMLGSSWAENDTAGEALQLRGIETPVLSDELIGYTRTGVTVGFGNSEEDSFMRQLFYCPEEFVGPDGTMWKYNSATGFGFCKYAGNREATKVIANPIGKTPAMVWVKAISWPAPWRIYSYAQGITFTVPLSTEGAYSKSELWHAGITGNKSVTLGGDLSVNNFIVQFNQATSSTEYTEQFNFLAANKDIIVAVGDSAGIQTSVDGKTWITPIHPNPGGSSVNFTSVTWEEDARGKGKFVVFDRHGAGTSMISYDGIVWELAPDIKGSYVSTLDLVFHEDQKGVINSAGTISIRNKDTGVSRMVINNGPPVAMVTIIYFKDHWVTAGKNGIILYSPDPDEVEYMLYAWFGDELPIETANTRLEWKTSTELPKEATNLFSNDTTVFACLIDNMSTIYTTTDGVEWIARTIYGATALGTAKVTWGGNIFVSVGDNGIIQTSPDGITWTTRNNANGYTGQFTALVWNGTSFVAGGAENFELQVSSNGIDWTEGNRPSDTNGVAINKLIWNNNVFLALANGYDIYTSLDGITWVLAANPMGAGGSAQSTATFASNESTVVWIYNKFIKVGTIVYGGEWVWTTIEDLMITTMDVIWNENYFIVTGFLSTSNGLGAGAMQSSSGIDWYRSGMAQMEPNFGERMSLHLFNNNVLLTYHRISIQFGMSKKTMLGTENSVFGEVRHTAGQLTKMNFPFEPDILLIKGIIEDSPWLWFSRAIGWNYLELNNTHGARNYFDTTSKTIEISGNELTFGANCASELLMVVAFKEVTNGCKVMVSNGGVDQNTSSPTIKIKNSIDYITDHNECLAWSKSRTANDWMRFSLSGLTKQTVVSLAPTAKIPERVPLGIYNFTTDGVTLSSNSAYADSNISEHFLWKTNEKFTLDGIEWNVNREIGFAWALQTVAHVPGSVEVVTGLLYAPTSMTITNAGIFLLTDAAGNLFRSNNGIDWDLFYTSEETVLHKCIEADGVYILAGSEGIRYFDGTWHDATMTGYAGGIVNIVWNGSMFVAIGRNREIQTSPDGITWTHRAIDISSGYLGEWNGLVWNGATFLVIGNSGEIQTSTNGEVWESRQASGGYTGTWNGIASKENHIVAVGDNGEIQTSTNGIDWTICSIPSGYHTVSWSVVASNKEGWLVASSTGQKIVSEDGITWSNYNGAGLQGKEISCLVGVGTFFVAIDNQFNTWISHHITLLKLPLKGTLRMLMRIEFGDVPAPQYIWRSDMEAGKVARMGVNGELIDSNLFGETEVTENYLFVDNRHNTTDKQYLNQMWFAPRDPSLAYHGIFEHQNGTPSSVVTDIINPRVILYGAWDSGECWVRCAPDWNEEYSLVRDDLPIAVSPLTVVDGTIIFPQELPTGRTFMVVIGDSRPESFNAVVTAGGQRTYPTGINSSVSLTRMVSNIGVEDGTGYLWQLLSSAGQFNDSSSTVKWETDNSGQGKRHSSGGAGNYILAAGGKDSRGGSEAYASVDREVGSTVMGFRGCADSATKRHNKK